MLIIEIQPLENGAHRNQTCNLNTIPEGWAEVPPEISVPDTFPFVDFEVNGQIVIDLTAGPVPEPEPEPEPEPTLEDRVSSIETAIERGLAL